MIARGDRAYSAREQERFARYPSLALLYRWFMWLRFELLFFPAIRGNRLVARRLTELARQNLQDNVPDPALREALVPDYPITAKRMLISDDYYPTLNRPNVHLITDGIERCTAEGIVTQDGRTIPADVIILATGFQTTAFLTPMTIEGLDGRSLEDAWRGGAEAYLGITVAGFPNFFMTYGPNTNLGHNSIIFMIECQTRYIIECIQALQAPDLRYLDVRQDVMSAYNRRVQRELQRTTWAAADRSWYKNTDGKITNNWYGTTFHYWWRTRQVRFDLYEQIGQQRGTDTRTRPGRSATRADTVISYTTEPSIAAPRAGRSSVP
jgi:cation diffusion facilitator CzcD-associated flavoprotein CzcO